LAVVVGALLRMKLASARNLKSVFLMPFNVPDFVEVLKC
jgi:hypothetical protein